ncbi:hypothetical protein GCM10020001_000200 [Nonomuraea salmonea]
MPITMTSVMTPEVARVSSEVTACLAPITSVLTRLTSAPVWVRVKNATGCRCTRAKTSERRS